MRRIKLFVLENFTLGIEKKINTFIEEIENGTREELNGHSGKIINIQVSGNPAKGIIVIDYEI